MITKYWWEERLCKSFIEPIHYLEAVLGSIITIPLDIVLSPFELIALIVYKIHEKRRK